MVPERRLANDKREIELRRITVEHRPGNLTTRASSIIEHILGRNHRPQSRPDELRPKFSLQIKGLPRAGDQERGVTPRADSDYLR